MAETEINPKMEIDPEVIVIDDDTDEEMAENKKNAGNKFYKLSQYHNALPLYTEAIKLRPDCASYYGNRAACYVMLNKYKEALDDAKKSVSLDPNFAKGYLRMAKCFIAFGDLAAARNALEKMKELEPDNEVANSTMRDLENIVQFKEKADAAYSKKEYRLVVYCMDKAIALGVKDSVYKLCKAESLAFLNRFQEAQEIANDVLHNDKQCVDGIYVRGLCLYHEDNVDLALTHFQHALKLAPDHTKVQDVYRKAKALKQKKDEGNVAFKAGRYEEAYKLYTEALAIDQNNKPVNAKLYCNRANVCSKLGRLNESVADCTSALKLDDKYLKALLRRAKSYTELEDYEEAVNDYELINKMDKSSHEYRRLLSEAKILLRRSKKKDYYKILGVTKSATTEDIKKAYRKRALVHHPDRHANASEGERLEQEKRFKEVGEAYGILSDPKKRARYDNGEDLMGEMDGGGHDFRTFFADGATFSFDGGNFPYTFQFG